MYKMHMPKLKQIRNGKYRTRKESRGKRNRDNANDKQLMVIHIDHNQFDSINGNKIATT